MGIIIEVAKFVLNVIYSIYKLVLREKKKITFLSRQSDEPSIDFKLLTEEIKRQNPEVKVRVLTKKIGKGIAGKLLYAFHIFRQMHHIATSEVVVIDGYQIAVSVLKQRKSLKVIQMWHALGSLKKFGYSVMDKGEGSKKLVIEKMNMHKNYYAALASSEISKKNFAEAFNMPQKQIKVMGLPRIDFLTSSSYKELTINKIIEAYPILNNNKKNIVYVPTFRKNSEVDVTNIVSRVDYNKYNLIIKLHSGEEKIYVDNMDNIVTGDKITGMEFLHIADAVITDYSAISYEAAIANKPLYFYVYDYEKYKKTRDMYLNFEKEMPGVISSDVSVIIDSIEKEVDDEVKRKKFVNKYIATVGKNNTKILAQYLLGLM